MLFIKGLSDIELNTLDTLTELGLASVGTELPPGAAQATLLGAAVVSVTISISPRGVRGAGPQPRRGNLLI